MMNLLRAPTATLARPGVDPLDSLLGPEAEAAPDVHRDLDHDHDDSGYEIRFESLFRAGRAMSFPCDRSGCVNCDALPSAVKTNYLFARAMVGREFATPVVRWCGCHTH